MAAGLENFQTIDAHDPAPPDASDITKKEKTVMPNNKLDSEENVRILGYLESQWREAHEAHAENRREQMIDADFYDHIQWTLEDSTILMNRGQAPLVYNLVKQAVDWMTGTERRTRVDWRVYGRSQNDEEGSRAKTALLKYLYDVNAVGFERSAAFKDSCMVGVGWMEEGIRADGDGELIINGRVDWKEMLWDPYSRRPDLTDCRYVIRERYWDEDWAIATFPDRAEKIREGSLSAFDTDSLSAMEDWNGLPMVFTNLDRFGRMTRYGHLIGNSSTTRRNRRRVKIMETWYRRPVTVKKVKPTDKVNNPFCDWNPTIFDSNNPDQVKAIEDGYLTLTSAVSQEIWVAMWVQGTLLQNMPSPYKHKRFGYTPSWCYRRHRDGMPYGLIRGARDPQEDYNKRRSKAQFHLSAAQVLYEDGAIDEAEEDDVLDQVSQPNGKIRLQKGALSEKRFEIRTGKDLAQAEIGLMENSAQSVMQIAGINRDTVGESAEGASGRAIIAKQQQGAVTTAEVFDNYRWSFQQSGQKLLSLTEQFMPMPKQIRVLGASNTADYVHVNEPYFDDASGQWMFRNDITKQEADFIVDQQDYRETVRQAMAESLFDLLSKIDPNVAIKLLDLAVDMTDLPNKEELVKRIRMINGQAAPGEQLSPELQQQLDQQAQQQAQDKQLQDDSLKAKTARDEAAANKDNAVAGKETAQTKNITVEGKGAALETAAKVSSAPQLAQAADNLYDFQGPEYDNDGNPNPAPSVLN